MKNFLLVLVTSFLISSLSAFADSDLSLSSISTPSLNSNSVEAQSTSLRIAAREGRLKDVYLLLDRGVDVNGTGEFGETALMYAARFNFPQVSEVLIGRGAEVNARDSADNTALIMAAKNCSSRISVTLISHGVDANWINLQGRSALIEAAADGCAPIVEQLLHMNGIRLDQKDNQGSTALDYASEEGQVEVGGPYSTIINLLSHAGAHRSNFVIPAQPAHRPN